MFCRNPSKQSQTANIAKKRRIYYRHHPLFEKEVVVVCKRDSRSHEECITQLPDGTRCVLPGWMFDKAYCLALKEVDRAVISVDALFRLTDLLASHQGVMRISAHESNAIVKTKPDSTGTSCAGPAPIASSTEGGLGASKASTPMRRTVRRVADKRCQNSSSRRGK